MLGRRSLLKGLLGLPLVSKMVAQAGPLPEKRIVVDGIRMCKRCTAEKAAVKQRTCMSTEPCYWFAAVRATNGR